MKKMLPALFFITVLAVPSFAEGNFRFGANVDIETKFKMTMSHPDLGSVNLPDQDVNTGFSFHGAYAPFITDGVRLGAGAAYWVPRNILQGVGGVPAIEVSHLAFYATSLIYPGRIGGGAAGGINDLYAKINLGYSLPFLKDPESGEKAEGIKGGFYMGLGLGLEFANNFFAEVVFARHGLTFKEEPDLADNKLKINSRFTSIHLGVGVKF